MDILQAVKKTIAELMELDAASIMDEDELYETLGIGSTGIIELLLELEIRCSIEFNIEELDRSDLFSVKSLANYIENKI